MNAHDQLLARNGRLSGAQAGRQNRVHVLDGFKDRLDSSPIQLDREFISPYDMLPPWVCTANFNGAIKLLLGKAYR